MLFLDLFLILFSSQLGHHPDLLVRRLRKRRREDSPWVLLLLAQSDSPSPWQSVPDSSYLFAFRSGISPIMSFWRYQSGPEMTESPLHFLLLLPLLSIWGKQLCPDMKGVLHTSYYVQRERFISSVPWFLCRFFLATFSLLHILSNISPCVIPHQMPGVTLVFLMGL